MDDASQALLAGLATANANAEKGTGPECTTMQELIKKPNDVIHFLKRNGVERLGEFQVEDTTLYATLGDNSILVSGSAEREVDYEPLWRGQLRKRPVRNAGWSRMVTVVAYVVTVENAVAPDVQGLIHLLLRRWQTRACSHHVFGIPCVQAVIQFKWETFASRLLKFELSFYLVWLASFTLFTLLFQDEDLEASLSTLWRESAVGKVTILSQVFVFVGMTPFLVIEASTVWSYGWGWISVWNSLDTVTYVNQFLICILHLSRKHLHSHWLSVLIAVQCIALWFRLQYFSRVFRQTKFSFVDALREVILDIKWYLFFLLLLMWGFAVAFCILFRFDQGYDEFSNVGLSLMTVFTYALSGADLSTMLGSSNPAAAIIMGIVYQFLMALILMNLLISVMTNSLDRATEDEDYKLLLSKAQVIDELESTVPAFIEKLHPSWYPRYVHFLQVDRKYLDELSTEVKDGPEEESDMDKLMKKVDALAQQLEAVQRMLDMDVDRPASRSSSKHLE